MKLANTIKKDFWAKTFLYNVMLYQILMLFKFLEIFYVLFWTNICIVISYGLLTITTDQTNRFVIISSFQFAFLGYFS